MINKDRPYCLSIAGYDPTGGAGVLADAKTFEQNEVCGMAVITSNTLQTDDQFFGVEWVAVDEIKRQVSTLMNKYPFVALKIGLVQHFESLYQIISLAKELNPDIQIVWDPILKSSSGFHFHNQDSMQLSFLEENCTLITPNWDEFRMLWGDDIERLKSIHPKTAVLIKGGHRSEKTGCDLLYTNGEMIDIKGVSFNGKSKHGTGCVLSAAIIAFLTKGDCLSVSCEKAKKYVEKFILSNHSNLGYHHDGN